MTKKLICAYTETSYKNYPAVLNISQEVEGGMVMLMVREAENQGNKGMSEDLARSHFESQVKQFVDGLDFSDSTIDDKRYESGDTELLWKIFCIGVNYAI